MDDIQAKATLNALERCIRVFGRGETEDLLRALEVAGNEGVSAETVEKMLAVLEEMEG